MATEQNPSGTPPPLHPDPRTIRRASLALLLAVAGGLALAYATSPAFRAEIGRAGGVLASGDADAVRDYLRGFGYWAPAASLGLMVAQALAAPFPHFLIVFANGLAFGLWWGWGLSLIGQTLAAAVCFWLARALGRAPVEALVGRFGLATADRWFARWGTLGVLLTRLVPGVGFDGVSYAAGLTGIAFPPFIAATVAGTAPQAFLYVYLGRHAPGSVWLLLAISGGLLLGGLGLGWWKRRRATATPPAAVRELPVQDGLPLG